VFGGCMVLFHLANASMLPLVSQNLAHDKLALSPLFMAALLTRISHTISASGRRISEK
jgi:hypothetical protein